MTEPSQKKVPPSARFAVLNLLLGLGLLVAALAGFAFGFQKANAEILLVLNYHGVVDQPIRPWEIKYEELKRHLAGLRQYGFEPLSPKDFPDWWNGKRPGGRKFLLTFDDGLKSSGDAIRKLKLENNIDSILFLVTDFIGKPDYLSEGELSGLASQGTFLALHGKRHEEIPPLIDKGENLSAELAGAKEKIENISGQKVAWMAYPFGVFNEKTRQAVASAGISFAFTIESKTVARSDNPRLLPRVMYLRGIEKTGEVSLEDFIPPQEIRTSSLTLTLSMLLFIWALGILYRAYQLFRMAGKG